MTPTTDGFGQGLRLCREAVDAGVIPGGVVLGAREHVVRFHEAFGARQLDPTVLPATVDTVYDVASVTKAVITSVLAMRAVAEGKLALDDRVASHLPEFQGDGKQAVRVRHLLSHASGLPAHRPFCLTAGVLDASGVAGSPDGGAVGKAREAILAAVAREPLIREPAQASVYSDLGFILLGWILERLAGERLDRQARRVWSAVPLPSTGFVDLAEPGATAALTSRLPVAPTERCPARGRMVQGEVHDLNAHAMGGVAGHAGLFSNAADLGAMASALVRAWQGAGDGAAAPAVVSPDVIREFWRPSGIPGSTWRLGWDGPAAKDSQVGSLLSREAVGHLGFTGCSLWIDPGRALWVVLLTNRIHPQAREDPRFRRFRAGVHDAAVTALLAAG